VPRRHGNWNLLFWLVAGADLPHAMFVASMVVAGYSAGLLNGTTVRVLDGAVPPGRAGMASGLASTPRFVGILVAVAGLGVLLSNGARRSFITDATAAGLGHGACSCSDEGTAPRDYRPPRSSLRTL
jgi:hypothetical protein